MISTARGRQISDNYFRVRENITNAAIRSGRDPKNVHLVAVTKTVGVEEIEILYNLGLRDFGENRLQDAMPKISALSSSDIKWHMIGTIQSRKAKSIALLFHFVHSIDRIKIAQELDKQCEMVQRIIPVFIQVNTSGEATKHGFSPEELPEVLSLISAYSNLQVIGLMTMAPLVDNPEKVRPFFSKLRELAEQFRLPELSMGMSNDYMVAIEEGATFVRIGAALFS